MKAFKLLSLLAILTTATFVSCEKYEDDGNGSSDKDLTKKEILVKQAWMLDEVLANNGGQNSHYVRGGTNTTGVNYDAVRATFNADGTGTYTTDLGETFPTTWKFSTLDQRNMEFAISYPAVVTYNWNLVVITKDELHNTTAISPGGSDLLVSARYVPVPTGSN